MANDASGEQMQARIAAARREAEGLKDRIKRKKDDLADTTRESDVDILAWIDAFDLLIGNSCDALNRDQANNDTQFVRSHSNKQKLCKESA